MGKWQYQSNRKSVEAELTKREIQALESIGVFVDGEASNHAPVGQYPANSGRVGGNLRSSLNHRVNNSDKTVTVGTPVEYAGYVEKGTSRQRSQPYLTPAVEDNKGRIRSLVEEVMRF